METEKKDRILTAQEGKVFLLEKVRVLFPHLFQPGGKLNKFGLQILIPKTNLDAVERFKKAISLAIETKWPNKKPVRLKLPLKDGDSIDYENHALKEAYSKHYIANLGRNEPIRAIDPEGFDLEENSDIQITSGDWCNVIIDVFSYDNQNQGVTSWAKAVQLVEKGDPLGYSEVPIESFFKKIFGSKKVGTEEGISLENLKDIL